MEMTPLQIASEYRTGKNKTITIKVLAELNAVTQRQIAEILQEQGEELPTVWENKLKEPRKRPPRGPKVKGVPAREIGEAILEAVTPEAGPGDPSTALRMTAREDAALSLDEIRHAALDLIRERSPGESVRFQGYVLGVAALVQALEESVERRQKP